MVCIYRNIDVDYPNILMVLYTFAHSFVVFLSLRRLRVEAEGGTYCTLYFIKRQNEN